MTYPCYYTNTETKKTYYLTLSKQIVSNQKDLKQKEYFTIKATHLPTEWGSVDWEIEGSEFLLKNIQSHPEEGTGLGCLLMHLAAIEAQLAKCNIIIVCLAAISEREFYFKMGCSIDTSPIKKLKEEDYSIEEWGKMSSSCPVVAAPDDVVVKSSKSVYKRWV